MRISFFSSACLLTSVAAIAACTTTSTVGENPGETGQELAPGGSSGSSGASGGPSSPPVTAPSTPGTPPDTKGVVAVTVSAEHNYDAYLSAKYGDPGGTHIKVVLRDQDWVEALTPGGPDTCETRPNSPPPPNDPSWNDRSIDLAFTANVTAGGKTVEMVYTDSVDSYSGTRRRSLHGEVRPPLPDGTPIAVTFGPEVPALAGKTVTLPAATTTLLAPALKPAYGHPEYRAYTPGSALDVAWSGTEGADKVRILGSNMSKTSNLLDCFGSGGATSFTVPESYMSTVTQVSDPSQHHPSVLIRLTGEQVQQIDTIKVRKMSQSTHNFQLNLAP